MEEQETTQITAEVGTGQVITPTPEAAQTTGTQGAETDYKPDWYKTDGRIGKIWKSPDPRDDIVKSYYHLEPKYKETADKLKNYETGITNLGVEFEKLPEIYKEYQTLKDPNSLDNQTSSYFKKWAMNPLYQKDIENFYTQLEIKELQRQFPGMNQEQIKKQIELEQKVNAFEAKDKERTNQDYYTRFSQTLGKQLAQNEKLAKDLGFNYTPEIDQAVRAYCQKFDDENGYPISAHQAFIELYGDKLEIARRQKIETEVLERQTKKTGTIPSGNPKTVPGKVGLRETLKQHFDQNKF